jgi:hypothetical protein
VKEAVKGDSGDLVVRYPQWSRSREGASTEDRGQGRQTAGRTDIQMLLKEKLGQNLVTCQRDM